MTKQEHHIDPLFQINSNNGGAPSDQLWHRLENKLDKAKYQKKLKVQRWISVAAALFALFAVISLIKVTSVSISQSETQFVIEDLISTDIESDEYFRDVLYLSSLDPYQNSTHLRIIDREDIIQ